MERRMECACPPRCAGATRPAPLALYPMFAAMLLAMSLMTACQAIVQRQQADLEVQRKLNVKLDKLRLMVYTSDLTEPYEKLGELSYTDPLNGETIDTDHINEKLRQMAIARWGQQVDAIILVTTKVGAADPPTISVTGEAVRMKGSCSGCRHNLSMHQAE
ncbi:MAG TPA: hypothetical protein VNE82_09930 [Candidatus Binataceae bacterium]|nr:hypothetical protein [Candidatus Binataceae bacterium]